MQRNRYIHCGFMLLGLCAVQLTAAGSDKEPPMAIKLAENYLPSFPIEETKPVSKAVSAAKPVKKQKKDAKEVVPEQVSLTPAAERTLVFKEIFAKSQLYQTHYPYVHAVLNPYAWNDLHLFCGTTATPAYHLFSRINKTLTVVGESALASCIASPTADLQALTNRQQVIAHFRTDKQLSDDLKASLNRYRVSEKQLLSLWSDTDPLYGEEYDQYLTRLFYREAGGATNKNASSLQTKKLWVRDIWNIYTNFVWYPLVFGTIVCPLNALFDDNVSWKSSYSTLWPCSWPVLTFWKVHERLQPSGDLGKIGGSKFWSYLGPTAVTLHSFYQYYRGYRNYKEYSAVLNNLALRMADVQTFLRTAQQVHTLIKNNPKLAALYGPKLVATKALLERIGEPSEVGTLLYYLDILPLRSWRYLFSHAGKLLASYKLFVEHKEVLHDALYELGQLDALLSIATLMEETAALGIAHGYVFTQLLPGEQYDFKPHLAISGMWNPMLDPKVAVGNDVAMGAGSMLQTMILTGPNAGGKSTFLTGVIYAVLLSQTFGIAPARSCALTPFSKINTYIDTTDDIAAGKSLFMAEVQRFNEHVRLLQQLTPAEFSLTIFDEPFSGTNPKEGAAASYSVLNNTANYTNALSIIATHYPQVMLLEDREPAKGFKNYKVYIRDKEKGQKIEYTYKVVPGKSDQMIAIDILEEQGCSTDILRQAREILANEQKYKQSFAPNTKVPPKPKARKSVAKSKK